MKLISPRILGMLFVCSAVAMSASHEGETSANQSSKAEHPISQTKSDGIVFKCKPDELDKIEAKLEKYFEGLNISKDHFTKRRDSLHSTLRYTLNTPENDEDTISLSSRPEYKIKDEEITLPTQDGKGRVVSTVSKKEIALALMQHGRLTQFKGKACDADALIENIGIRQNTVAWTQRLYWGWPENKTPEGHAYWNKDFWNKGTPLPGIAPHVALMDAFLQQDKYAIGCYTASKLVMAQGITDYYARVNPDPKKLKIVEDRLNLDKDPLVNVEPPAMWNFEAEYDPKESHIPGKILKIQRGISGKNIIPGDWYYILNTDAETYKKVGYEGSNSIYLGRNQVDDFYYDTAKGYYTHTGKIDEVYQWRHHVFSHERDADKIEKLSNEKLESLMKTPEKGGLMMDFRVSPYLFGFEDLP